MRLLRTVLAAVLLVAGVAACGDDDAGGDGARVVATTSILGDVVRSIVGDDVEVEVLIPPGTDPHDAAPSARQAADLRSASLVVANGLGLEAGLADALDAAADDGVRVIEIGELVEPLPFGDAHEHDDEGEHDEGEHDDDEGDHDEGQDHAHGDEDPHLWHDPVRMAQAVPGLTDALVDALPDMDADAIRARSDDLVAELEALDAEIREILAAVPAERRYLLTNHETFGYLAERYDFEVIGAALPGGDTLSRPSAQEIATLVEEIEAHDLPAIFAENVSGDQLIRTIAEEAGREVEVVALHTDALGEPGSGADTYLGMLRTNAELIASALG
ncbi:metal ABC transporter substrate-binding protein [Actinomarinicola tropica]|uniref:Zinc ABC transporter substrate-binding protein n=1 Tax=Actinomarinicola tropica TaxID=2789776 RepID=A0A5Q2RGP5_9ACTN|nr:metal ABC transporter substrate-binding protein [Actinomarinicola tropica]QGG94804.1 zinc ABC transporter substrate-binding protein [Actinomarinicola tropica]